MHKLRSSDHPVSPQQDTEVWERRKEKKDAQRQVLLLGLEPPSLLQPQHREPQGGFHATWQRDKRLQLWDILTPLEPGQSQSYLVK